MKEIQVSYDDQPNEVADAFVAILEKLGAKVTVEWKDSVGTYKVDTSDIELKLFRLESCEH